MEENLKSENRNPKATAQANLGLAPIYYPGQHQPEKVGFSRNAKIIVGICILLAVAFVVYLLMT